MWGGLHSAFFALNHGWRAFRRAVLPDGHAPSGAGLIGSRLLTFAAVSFAWVPFRAEGFDATLVLWRGLIGLNGISLAPDIRARLGALAELMAALGVRFDGYLGGIYQVSHKELIVVIPAVLFLCWFAPTSQAMLAEFDPGLASRQFLHRGRQLPLLQWKPSGAWALAVGMLAYKARHAATRQYEVLLIGSSKTAVFNADHLPETRIYNASFAAAQLGELQEFLETYGGRAETVLIGLDPYMFN